MTTKTKSIKRKLSKKPRTTVIIAPENARDHVSSQLQSVPLSSIKLSKQRIRNLTNNESIENLTQSIKEDGLIAPIIVDQNMELRDGGRRWKAAQDAGLKMVDVIVKEKVPKYIELIANQSEPWTVPEIFDIVEKYLPQIQADADADKKAGKKIEPSLNLQEGPSGDSYQRLAAYMNQPGCGASNLRKYDDLLKSKMQDLVDAVKKETMTLGAANDEMKSRNWQKQVEQKKVRELEEIKKAAIDAEEELKEKEDAKASSIILPLDAQHAAEVTTQSPAVEPPQSRPQNRADNDANHVNEIIDKVNADIANSLPKNVVTPKETNIDLERINQDTINSNFRNKLVGLKQSGESYVGLPEEALKRGDVESTIQLIDQAVTELTEVRAKLISLMAEIQNGGSGVPG